MSKNVVATIREDAPFVPAGRYYLFSEPAVWTLMPTDEGSGQLPLTLDKGAYTEPLFFVNDQKTQIFELHIFT